MAKQKKIVGSGITAKEMTVHSGQDLAPALKRILGAISADITARGQYGMVSWKVVEQARSVSAGHDRDRVIEQSPQDYAFQIMKLDEVIKHSIEREDADEAARFAFQMGCLFTEALIKQDWEIHALRGKKNADSLALPAQQENQERHHQRQQKDAQIQQIAADKRSRNPHLTNSAIADQIASATELYGTERTIRKALIGTGPRARGKK
ncbi:hypothetical protein [Niveispirillum sp. KHB5.9]|uniref:hypothetical protein n=1 Tax=Niveispirillum sp. KHB5.9 TaxID=3400269 RepID=UPI003A83AA84